MEDYLLAACLAGAAALRYQAADDPDTAADNCRHADTLERFAEKIRTRMVRPPK